MEASPTLWVLELIKMSMYILHKIIVAGFPVIVAQAVSDCGYVADVQANPTMNVRLSLTVVLVVGVQAYPTMNVRLSQSVVLVVGVQAFPTMNVRLVLIVGVQACPNMNVTCIGSLLLVVSS